MGMPVVIAATGGLPVVVATNGLGVPCTIATNGFGIRVTQSANGIGMPVAGVTFGPSIVLTGNTVLENSAVNTVVGALSMSGTTGTPAYTLTDSAGGRFKLVGSSLQVAAATIDFETATSHNITISVSGVTPTVTATTFTIVVLDVSGVAPAAPTLTLTTGPTDNTPDFNLTGDLVLGDTVRFQYSTSSSFSGASELTNTIDAGEDAANLITFTTGALANGTWYFRARIERPESAMGGWSNTETITIAVVAPSYTGPGDLATGWISWYGLRAFSAATAGTPCCTIRRTSDNATLVVSTLANGTFDIASVTTFLTATTGLVISLVDQTVNTYDVGQNVGADPTGGGFTLNAINSRPGMTSTASYAMTGATTGLAAPQAQPYSISAVAKRASGAQSGCIGYSSNQIFFPAAANQVTFYAGGGGVPTPVAATDNVFHDINVVVDGANSITCVDGVDTTGINANTTSAMPTAEQFQFPANGPGGLVGTVLEGGFFAGAFTAPQRAAIAANQQAYYGHR